VKAIMAHKKPHDNSLESLMHQVKGFESPQHKALIHISWVASWFQGQINASLRPLDISVQQYNILRILNGSEEPLRVSQIGERMVDKCPHLTRLLTKLESRKYITKKPASEDRRISLVSITAQGRKFLNKATKCMEPINAIADKITQKEAETLNQILDKVRS